MEDRVSLYPGRVKLTPVPGQENTYDLVRADSPTRVGTQLNKNSLLKDTTSEKFGLGSGAVPDDVFSWIGKYNEHWWSMLHGKAYSYYEEKQTKLTEMVHVARVYYGSSDRNLQYSKKITINQSTGEVSLLNPSTITIAASSAGLTSAARALVAAAPCYIITIPISSQENGKLCYIPEGATWDYNSSESTITRDGQGNYDESGDMELNATAEDAIRASTVSSQIVAVPAGATTYDYSENRNAYPDGGTVDGITYQYLGVPFDKFPTMTRIATGSYVGTGTYGASNPCSLTFDFVPKIIFIANKILPDTALARLNYGIFFPSTMRTSLVNGSSASYTGLVCVHTAPNGSGSPSFSIPVGMFNDLTCSWYSTRDSFQQLNYGGGSEETVTYYYYAIG